MLLYSENCYTFSIFVPLTFCISGFCIFKNYCNLSIANSDTEIKAGIYLLYERSSVMSSTSSMKAFTSILTILLCDTFKKTKLGVSIRDDFLMISGSNKFFIT